MVATDWEQKYSRFIVQALSREVSGHTPLFLHSGTVMSDNPHSLKFEMGWLLRDGFFVILRDDVWSEVTNVHTPLGCWQAKIRRLRQYLRGSDGLKNISGKEKKRLLNKMC